MVRASRGVTRRPHRGASQVPALRVGATAVETRHTQRPPPPSLPIAFGPVRSRGLGWSLGINNVPVDYATFVPDGEPTLDLHLGEAIRGVAGRGLKVAILTNGGLLWRDDVREELTAADLVSVKVDTVDEPTWRRLNRPIGNLRLETVLDGMRSFAADYHGDLVTETTLVAGINDDDGALIEQTARFIGALEPVRAYVAIPTRPPVEPWVRAPSVDGARRAADIFRVAELPTEPPVEDDCAETFSPSSDLPRACSASSPSTRCLPRTPEPTSTVRAATGPSPSGCSTRGASWPAGTAGGPTCGRGGEG